MHVSSQEVVASHLPVLVLQYRARDTSLPLWGVPPLTYTLRLRLILRVFHQLAAVAVCEWRQQVTSLDSSSISGQPVGLPLNRRPFERVASWRTR